MGPTPNTTSAYKPLAPLPQRPVNLTIPPRPATRGPVPAKSGSQDTLSQWGSNLTQALSSTPYVNTTASSCFPSTLQPWPSTATPSRPVMPKTIVLTPHSHWHSCSSIVTNCGPCTPRARPCVPWSNSSNSAAVWSATKCVSPIASRVLSKTTSHTSCHGSRTKLPY